MRQLLLGMTTALVVFGSGCGGEDSDLCGADVPVQFSSVSETEQSELNINGVVLTVDSGDVLGYVDGATRVLLLYEAELSMVPPCGAAEVELVLDQTQVGVQVELFDSPSAEAVPFFTESSSLAATIAPAGPPYERWTITAPAGHAVRRLTVSNAGSVQLSTLIKSVTFR